MLTKHITCLHGNNNSISYHTHLVLICMMFNIDANKGQSKMEYIGLRINTTITKHSAKLRVSSACQLQGI